MDLVFEIGCEELPASFQLPAVQYMRDELSKGLAEARLLGGASLKTYATPRRLAVLVTGIEARAEDVRKKLSGPPAKAAFVDGKPTKAAEGFAKKAGVPLEALQIEGDRVVVEQTVKGQSADEALPPLLAKIIRGIPFRKSMRWGSLETDAFARPVHWIGAALDGKPLKISFADVESGASTRGHRFHAPQEIPLPDAATYVDILREAHVLADWEERKQRIAIEVARAAKEAGGVPRPDDELLEIVTGLVEEPTGVVGRFEEEFLQLPPEVLVSEMRGHQKYFAVQNENGSLLPAFVAVSNTRVQDPAVSRKGYERLLRARLSDGKFFFDEDRKSTLRSRVEKLGRRTFLAGLGTEQDRANRLRELSLWLHGTTGRAQPAQLAEAAELCKADLTTGMVGEFPELQGSMGRVYALHDGISPVVADAIFEHYLPRGADDKLPQGDAGALLGLADRIDQLVGLFGIGKEPTGTADPYGQRRAALGLIRLTLTKGYRFDLYKALRYAQEQHKANEKVSQEPALLEKIWAFLLGRLEVQLKDRAQPDSIQAALHTGAHDLVSLEKRVLALQDVRQSRRAQFEATAAAFRRIANILAQAAEKKIAAVALQPALAKLPAEASLLEALKQSQDRLSVALDEGEDYPAAYAALADLRPAVDAFFDGVMVMDPDSGQRDNRLAMLRALHELFAPLADFARLQVDKSA
ncbi:MAG TPA: glycine--tRNA ligase subunit beta [Myxococcales bacterium]|jgi:glycyl-tRNA synthetase beta chain|nr:glycine--tRNA ligase subunit beta [Myxococcales bacterium]